MKDGTNTYTAVAKDAYGRSDTNTVSVFLPVSTSFAYDLNGNMLSDGRRGFEYDDENQLVRVTMTNAWRSEFVYDGKMRRRERIECVWQGGAWVTNEIVHYIYDGNLVLQERHYQNPQLSTLNPQLVTYTRGLDLSGSLQGAGGIGGLLARSEISNLQSPHAYYHADGNGNITCLVNGNNAVVAKYIYDPYGNIISASGPLAEANLYRFSSKEWHVQSGLVYYLYRFYEPNLQRWVTRDPIGERGGLNLLRFVRNAPVGRTDSRGLVDESDPPRPDSDWLSSCASFLCSRIAAAGANSEILRTPGLNGNDDRGGGNAFRHCLSGCEVSRQCGAGGQKSWDGRENSGTGSGKQDLANNRVGYEQAKKKGSCWDNCMEAWENQGLLCGSEPCPEPPRSFPEPEPPDPPMPY